ncbi:MAG TPA: MmgE/PrpD family protein [Gammaproteobacteria bacterium]|nr:MmgE/PrpD family protein [Gammaproteobacteria bacterium]
MSKAAHSKDGAQGSTLGELARILFDIKFAALDAATLDAVRARVLDALGALVVGLQTPEGRVLRRYAQRASGRGGTLDFAERCRLYVGAARATEVDDIDVASCTTVGSVVVPVALGVAARRSLADPRTLLAAVVAGYEAMQRLGRAIGGATLIYRGVWPTYVTAPFAAAATAAKLLELDAAATARALALALTRTSSVPAAALSRSGFRYYSLGCAAVEGADAASAAAAGVEADQDALAAFAERIGAGLDAALVHAAGEPWLVREVDSKPWPTSRQALASVAAFRALELAPASIDAIERIVVGVPGAYRAMIDRAAPPAQRIESMIGVQYQVALAALTPDKLYDAIRTEVPAPPELASLMAKIEVRADEALDARFPRRWGSRVTVRFGSGEERTHEVLDPDGAAARPLDLDGVERKYARIFAASNVDKADWLGAARERCEQLARAAGDVGLVADLWASIE